MADTNQPAPVKDPSAPEGVTPAPTPEPETVPKDRYDAAVRQMNAKEQEAAALKTRIEAIEAEQAAKKQQAMSDEEFAKLESLYGEEGAKHMQGELGALKQELQTAKRTLKDYGKQIQGLVYEKMQAQADAALAGAKIDAPGELKKDYADLISMRAGMRAQRGEDYVAALRDEAVRLQKRLGTAAPKQPAPPAGQKPETENADIIVPTGAQTPAEKPPEIPQFKTKADRFDYLAKEYEKNLARDQNPLA